VDVSPALYLRMAQACRYFLESHRPLPDSGAAESIADFLRSFKKGSGKFRKIVEAEKQTKKALKDLQTVKTYYRLTGINSEEEEYAQKNFSAWNANFFTNSTREFIFKFVNNCLPLNTRLSHYVPGKTRGCSFCEILTFRPGPDETFAHLFHDCPKISEWRERLDNDYIGNATRKENWFGIPDTNSCNDYLQMLRWLFLHTVWDFKLRQRTASWASFKIELDIKLERVLKASPQLRLKREMYNYHRLGILPPHG